MNALASIIDNNITASEKDEYVNLTSSSPVPIIELCTGVFTLGSEAPVPNYILSLHHLNTSGIYLTCISPDRTDAYTVCSTPVISDSHSDMDLYDIIKVSNLIDILRSVYSVSVECTWDSDKEFKYNTPISEITLKGPNLNKTIQIPTGTTIMEVIY